MLGIVHNRDIMLKAILDYDQVHSHDSKKRGWLNYNLEAPY